MWSVSCETQVAAVVFLLQINDSKWRLVGRKWAPIGNRNQFIVSVLSGTNKTSCQKRAMLFPPVSGMQIGKHNPSGVEKRLVISRAPYLASFWLGPRLACLLMFRLSRFNFPSEQKQSLAGRKLICQNLIVPGSYCHALFPYGLLVKV